jgi:hypothetical protein
MMTGRSKMQLYELLLFVLPGLGGCFFIGSSAVSNHVYLTEPEQLIDWIVAFEHQHHATGKEWVAVDCETNGDDPYQSTAFTLQMAVPELTAVVIT